MVLLACFGCAATKPTALPPVQAEALRLGEQGISAQAKGRSGDALAAFEEALRRYRSVEDHEGEIAMQINAARVCRLAGDLDRARRILDPASDVGLPQGLAGELRFEKAKLALAGGDLDAAEGETRRLLAGEGTQAAARSLNLLGIIALRRHGFRDGAELADRALRRSRDTGDRVEEANALRLGAACRAASGEWRAATVGYEAALVIDRELALPRKVAADLRGLGDVAIQAGAPELAIAYYLRAGAVSGNAGDTVDALRDLTRAEEFCRRTGRTADAERIRAERMAHSPTAQQERSGTDPGVAGSVSGH